MAVQLRNKSQERFVPDLNRTVKPEEIVEVPGSVVAELADCVVTKGPLGERAWPTELWSLVAAKKSTAADSKPESKE